jgi:hypothetical protein
VVRLLDNASGLLEAELNNLTEDELVQLACHMSMIDKKTRVVADPLWDSSFVELSDDANDDASNALRASWDIGIQPIEDDDASTTTSAADPEQSSSSSSSSSSSTTTTTRQQAPRKEIPAPAEDEDQQLTQEVVQVPMALMPHLIGAKFKNLRKFKGVKIRAPVKTASSQEHEFSFLLIEGSVTAVGKAVRSIEEQIERLAPSGSTATTMSTPAAIAQPKQFHAKVRAFIDFANITVGRPKIDMSKFQELILGKRECLGQTVVATGAQNLPICQLLRTKCNMEVHQYTKPGRMCLQTCVDRVSTVRWLID